MIVLRRSTDEDGIRHRYTLRLVLLELACSCLRRHARAQLAATGVKLSLCWLYSAHRLTTDRLSVLHCGPHSILE